MIKKKWKIPNLVKLKINYTKGSTVPGHTENWKGDPAQHYRGPS